MTLRGKTACLWHAYNALSEQSGKCAAKGQLKVLTHNLASLMHLTDVEKKLETLFVADSVFTFTDYLNFLKEELFQPLIESDPNNVALILSLDQIDNVCWFICSRTYFKRNNSVLNDNDIYKLWRLFNSVAETDDADEAIFPVVIDLEEAEAIFQRIMAILSMEHKKIDFVSFVGNTQLLSFPQFLHVIESHCLAGKESVASATVAELFDEQVAEVLKKGYLQRKGHGITGGWKDLWCVLTLTQFCLYSSRDEKELKEDLIITKSCKLENLPERYGISIGNIGLGTKANRFALNNTEVNKSLELSAQDAKTKSEWLSAIQSALDWSCRASSPRQLVIKMRKKERAEKRKRLEKEEELRRQKEEEIVKALMELGAEKKARLDVEERIRLEELRLLEEQKKMEETRKLLEEEKLAREKAEQLWQEEAQLREQEQQRLREMELLHRELEALLEAERQAKRDEEIVRSMQANILQEEFERREQLEKMRADLEKLLQEEQLRNIGLEEMRMKQEAYIQEEQQKLEALEKERERQEQEHLAAVMKLQKAEQLKMQMEEELKQKEIEQQKFVANMTRNPLTVQIGSHRGIGAFVDADYSKRHDLTPITPNSPLFNVVKVCRTPLSPPVHKDLVRNTDPNKKDMPPPIPTKRRNRSNLASLGGSEQETSIQEHPFEMSPKEDEEQDRQKAEITRCIEAQLAATCINANDI